MPTDLAPEPALFPAVETSVSAPKDLDAAFGLAYYTPLQEYRSAADTKAGALLTACGLLFTLLARYSSHVTALTAPMSVTAVLVWALLAGFAVFSLATVVYAFHTISPRFPEAPPSLAFFGDIAALSREEYIERIEAMDLETALGELVSYNHTLSAIIAEKFRQLTRAIRCFRIAGVCWLLLILLAGGHLLLG